MLSNLSILISPSWPWVLWALHSAWHSSVRLIERARRAADSQAGTGDAGSGIDSRHFPR